MRGRLSSGLTSEICIRVGRLNDCQHESGCGVLAIPVTGTVTGTVTVTVTITVTVTVAVAVMVTVTLRLRLTRSGWGSCSARGLGAAKRVRVCGDRH